MLQTELLPRFDGVGCSHVEFACVSNAWSLSWSDIWQFYVKLHLPIGILKHKTIKTFMQNKTVLQRINVPTQDTIVCKQVNRRVPISHL